ncbi:MAG: diheme cytochrome c [Betaproteobacteria bacterium]|nr:diheme cytochrome c [Betaproteobacteria bacterium]
MRRALPALLALLALPGLAGAALADGGNRAARLPLLPKYQQECAACHIAYPPGMLPAASWQRTMSTLQRHYGTDASLDPATTQELATWLAANAGTYKRVSGQPPEDRISRSAWFIRKHDEVAAATWKLPAVKSAANCSACHTQSDQGDFNERNIRIPR